MRALAHRLPNGNHPILQSVQGRIHSARHAVPKSYAALLACLTPSHGQVRAGSSMLRPDCKLGRRVVRRGVVAQAREIRRPCTASAASSQVEQSHDQPDAQTPPPGSEYLSLYNTMTRKKERVQPRTEGDKKLSMYCCGVTVYDLSHIGDSSFLLQKTITRSAGNSCNIWLMKYCPKKPCIRVATGWSLTCQSCARRSRPSLLLL